MLYETRFLIALLVTLIIETPVLFVLVRYVFRIKKTKALSLVFIGMIASALTLPYLWFVLSPYINAKYYIYYGEALVVLCEAVMYCLLIPMGLKKSLLASLIANALSFAAGLIIFS